MICVNLKCLDNCHNLNVNHLTRIMKIRFAFRLSTLFFFLACFFISLSLPAQEYIKSDFQVSDESDYYYQGPQLSVSKSGEMAVVWETVGSGDIFFKLVSMLGENMGPQTTVPTTYSTSVTKVVHNDSSNFMLIYGAFRNGWEVLGQTYTSEGVALTDTNTVDRNTSEMINMYRSSLNSNNMKQFAAFLPGLDSMIVEIFHGEGEYHSGPIVLKPGGVNPSEMYGMMTYKGELILVWNDGATGNYQGQRYTAEGTSIGDVFQISSKAENSYNSNPEICADSSGNFAVVWTNNLNGVNSIYSQLFSELGVPVGTNTLVTDDNASYGGVGMTIDMDLDGNFVVAWPDTRSSDTSFIYMQQLDEMGVLVGDNFRATSINNQISDGVLSLPTQNEPDVRILRDTIYLVWSNQNEDIHYRINIFANILEWHTPDVSGLPKTDSPSDGIFLYPNPSSGYFTLQLEQEIVGETDMSVYNPAGQLIYSKTIHLIGQSVEIELPEIKEGLYYLEFSGESIQSTKPLIIKR